MNAKKIIFYQNIPRLMELKLYQYPHLHDFNI
jgi:hypothetical protein